MKKVYLSPSNQADNIGAGNYGTEKQRMTQLVELTKQKLINKFDVKVANYDSTLASRVTEANNWNADIYVAFHTNAGGARGCEVYAYSEKSKGNTLANLIYKRIAEITPSADRGVKYNNLYETRMPNMPACLIEFIFHDNKEDVEWFLNNMNQVATETAKAICEYFNEDYEENNEEVKKENQKINYTYNQFVGDIQKSIGANVDNIAGPETLSKTVTVSKTKNSTHAVVKPLQKYLYSLGYTEVGQADGIAGAKFDTAVKHFQKDNGCVVDGEITSKNKTWKKILKLA